MPGKPPAPLAVAAVRRCGAANPPTDDELADLEAALASHDLPVQPRRWLIRLLAEVRRLRAN